MQEMVVLITGAAGRMGSAIAHGVISQGGKVIFVDVNEAGLEKITAGLDEESFFTIVADAGIPDEADRCIAAGTKKAPWFLIH